MNHLTILICTHNRADLLERVLTSLNAAKRPTMPVQILVAANTCTDETVARMRAYQTYQASNSWLPLRLIEVPTPGKSHALNRTILKIDAELTAFVKVGHIPGGSNLVVRHHMFALAGQFSAELGPHSHDLGGGEDAIRFRTLMSRCAKMRYCPDMAVWHFVEPWRLKRSYFLSLHYQAGFRKGRHELPVYSRTVLGIPPFLVTQFIGHCMKTLTVGITHRSSLLRQAMNASHTLGTVVGYTKRNHLPGSIHAN